MTKVKTLVSSASPISFVNPKSATLASYFAERSMLLLLMSRCMKLGLHPEWRYSRPAQLIPNQPLVSRSIWHTYFISLVFSSLSNLVKWPNFCRRKWVYYFCIWLTNSQHLHHPTFYVPHSSLKETGVCSTLVGKRVLLVFVTLCCTESNLQAHLPVKQLAQRTQWISCIHIETWSPQTTVIRISALLNKNSFLALWTG